MTQRLQPGAPGLYELPPEPLRALTGERMDVCAFLGVAPRGPARVPVLRAPWAEQPCAPGRTELRSVPVPVQSFAEYERTFGGFEGPGLLPYAVAAFFENGGRRAYVVRIVHDWRGLDPEPGRGVARGALQGLQLRGGGAVALRARDEGHWGNRLSCSLGFSARPLDFDAGASDLGSLVVARDAAVPVGTLLRLRLPGGASAMRFVSAAREEWRPVDGLTVRRALLEAPLGLPAVGAEIVEGTLDVSDGDPRRRGGPRRERFERLGLAAEHPRGLARVLATESTLLAPDERTGFAWLARDVEVPASLPRVGSLPFLGGMDRYESLVPEDFFSAWVPGDECPGDGAHALVDLPDVALLCAPDLYQPQPLVPVEDVRDPLSLASAHFAPCVVQAPPTPLQEQPAQPLSGLALDPGTELDTIIGYQRRLVDFAEQRRSFVALLDVPPGLSDRRMLGWRARFDSAFAAAYHPWLSVARPDDARDALIRLNPSAVAAGLIAYTERTSGLQHGPANLLARGVVALLDEVSPRRHDALHPHGLNVYVRERDGARLTAARTLSLDPAWRQLSVRRMVTMLERVLERQMQWVVFEPNGRKLRADLTRMMRTYLRRLYEAGAFTGAREDDAFFVRCDEALNPPRVIDAGQLIAQVGVAPAEPLEFIVLTLSRDGDGTLRVEA